MLSGIMDNTAVYLLVFVRMAGMIALNPLLNRRNVPSMVRAGLILGLTAILAPTVVFSPPAAFNSLDLVVAMIRELIAGFLCGYVFQIFYYMLFFAGDLMDIQFGISMAQVFDPSTNIRTSTSGNLLQALFVLYLFATNSHLLMIQIFATSYEIVPPGAFGLSSNVISPAIELFISVFLLALRLAIPFIVAEFILEVSMGILMKLIPQIHVFMINIQFKLGLGLLLLLLLASPVSTFLQNYTQYLFESMEEMLYRIAS